MTHQIDFAAAAATENHPVIRWVLTLNAHKVERWEGYAAWKRHAGHMLRVGGCQMKRDCEAAIAYEESKV